MSKPLRRHVMKKWADAIPRLVDGTLSNGNRARIEVRIDGYKQVYQSQQHPNLFLATDTPIDPGVLDWQELKKVQLQDY
jgi:hypothetical protein